MFMENRWGGCRETHTLRVSMPKRNPQVGDGRNGSVSWGHGRETAVSPALSRVSVPPAQRVVKVRKDNHCMRHLVRIVGTLGMGGAIRRLRGSMRLSMRSAPMVARVAKWLSGQSRTISL